MENRKKVMLALSGGVDSSVCAHILQSQGYEVYAVCMKMSDAHDGTVEAAKIAAEELNIPLTVLDLKEEFKSLIIDSFISDYENARTPNPCVICNPLIKFKYLKKTADEQGCEYFASGHYARISEENGRFFVRRAASDARDQSYMLYRLPQDILKGLLLPLGDMTKDEVRSRANELGLTSKNAPDSQENCFIPDNDYAAYIERNGGKNKKGNFIGPCGEILGAHKGIVHYTCGQRKGLGISYKESLFVDKIDAQSGDIFLTVSGGQMRSEIVVSDCVFSLYDAVCKPLEIDVKIRSAARAQAAILEPFDNGNFLVKFKEPASAPTPGQSAVFYIGDKVLGGGFITQNSH